MAPIDSASRHQAFLSNGSETAHATRLGWGGGGGSVDGSVAEELHYAESDAGGSSSPVHAANVECPPETNGPSHLGLWIVVTCAPW